MTQAAAGTANQARARLAGRVPAGRNGPRPAWLARPAWLRSWAAVAFVVATVVTGALERWWVGAHPIGVVTGDTAITGLMALHLLRHGQLSVYVWGQSYGGSLEAVLTAGMFAVAGVGTAQLAATCALSSGLAALALWRNGRWVVGERAAGLGALVFWVWPASFIWRSLKPGSTYQIGLAITLCAVGVLARARKGQASWALFGWGGLLCGLAAWSTPQCLELLVPAGLWFLPTARRLGRRLLALLPGAVAGASPAIVYGALHHWSNLHLPGGGHSAWDGMAGRLAQFFRIEAPLAMSLRIQRSFQWVGGPLGMVLAWLAAAGALAVVVAVASGRAERCRLPVLTLALLPVLFALNPLASHVGQARYVLFGASMGALLVGVGIDNAGPAAARAGQVLRRWLALQHQAQGRRPRLWPPGRPWRLARHHLAVWPLAVALLGALGATALSQAPAAGLVGFPSPDAPLPVNDHDLQVLVAEHHVRDAYADYWAAYRLMFETQEAVDVAPIEHDRNPVLSAKVAASPKPAYLFVAASATLGRFVAWCHQHAGGADVWRQGDFAVVQPATKVLPGQVPRDALP